jgi:hypothetical protein
MKTESKEYYAARERAERMAADKAVSPEAKQAHEELAQAYAQLAETAPDAESQPDGERPAAEA